MDTENTKRNILNRKLLSISNNFFAEISFFRHSFAIHFFIFFVHMKHFTVNQLFPLSYLFCCSSILSKLPSLYPKSQAYFLQMSTVQIQYTFGINTLVALYSAHYCKILSESIPTLHTSYLTGISRVQERTAIHPKLTGVQNQARGNRK